MSKGLGQKIIIRFTEDIVPNYETELSIVEKKPTSVNATYSGSLAYLIDNIVTSYWQSRSSLNFIQTDLEEKGYFFGFKVYKGGVYLPKTYQIFTSDNGIDFTQVQTGSFDSMLYRYDTVLLDPPVFAKHMRVSFSYSVRLYIYEFRALVGGYLRNREDFKIRWKEYQYIGGPLIDKIGLIKNLQRAPVTIAMDSTLLLEMHDTQRFNNAEGLVTVEYNAFLGNLVGPGGVVQSFQVSFTPTELDQKMAPHHNDTVLTIAPESLVNFIKIYHTKIIPSEIIMVGVMAEVIFVKIEIINP